MTAFAQQGFGAAPAQSRESQALSDINSRQKTFVNRDFVKNIAWLNNSVDVLSAYTQKLQKGVDEANQNAIEQLQAFASDLFVIFAGGQPTGIEIGDLKYVIQGIGAFFGINPGTPFPMNVFDAAWHMFETYIIPAQQFTDVIFDTIEAWAVDLGLSPELIQAMEDLRAAFEGIGATGEEFINSLWELLHGLPTIDVLGPFIDALTTLFDSIPLPDLKPILVMITDLGIPFIEALTAIVNGANSFLKGFSSISGSQIASLGENICPIVSDQTTVWNVGSNSATQWIFDETQSATTDSAGSFTTLGNGTPKRVLTQDIFPCTPQQTLVANAQLRWSGIPNAANGFGAVIVYFMDANEVSSANVNIPGGHGTTGGWSAIGAMETVVPQDVNGFKVGARNDDSITTGQIWADEITVQLKGAIQQNLIEGLIEDLATFLGINDPLNALNLFNLVPTSNIPGLDASKITSGQFDSTTLQPLIDALSTGWGGGTGLDFTGLNSLVAGLPGAQPLIDALANGLGHSGTGHTVSDILSYIGLIPGGNIASPVAASVVPNLDASKITSGQLAQSFLNITNIAANIVTGALGLPQIPPLPASQITSGSFAAGQIPTLDASKITSGILNLLQIPNLPAAQINSGTFGTGQIPALDASKIATGTFVDTFVPGLGATRDAIYQAINGGATTGTTTAQTKTALQNIPGGNIVTAILASIVPSLDASKILTGTLAALRIPSLPASQITTGTFGTSFIPSLPASQITSGTFGTGQIPALDASKITTGTLLAALVPNLPASIINSGTFPVAQIPDMDAAKIITGFLATGRIPNLDGSKITSGTIAQTYLNITSIAAGILTGTVPIAQIPTVDSKITSIDASKILSGILDTLRVPVLDAATKLSGVAPSSVVPKTLDISWVSGLWPITQIPIVDSKISVVDATKVSTGTLGAARLPDINKEMSSDLQQITDEITNSLIGAGNEFSDTAIPVAPGASARGSLDSIYRDVLGATKNIQTLMSTETATNISGFNVSINFSEYPDGPVPSNFTVIYSGTGTSTWGIKSGAACFRTLVADGNRNVNVTYNIEPTKTDYQIVRGSMSSAPSQGTGVPKIYACGRVDNPAAPQNYVWGRAYCVGFLTYKADLGYTVAGVETVMVSNIALTWSMDIRVYFGLGNQPRRYQVFSGSQLVWDHTEAGTISKVGAGFRYWGCRAEMKASGGYTAGPGGIAGTAVSDNAPPNVVGSGAHRYRVSTTTINYAAGISAFTDNFWETPAYISEDITYNPTGNRYTVANAGWYVVNAGFQISVNMSEIGGMVLFKNGVQHQVGDLTASVNRITGSFLVYLAAGDYVEPRMYRSGGLTGSYVRGDATGSWAYYSIGLASRSMK